MGSAVARRLHESGREVLTALDGRSAGTVQRANAAGMTTVERAELARADIFLSIVPPGAAISLAEEIAAEFAASTDKPLYVDCNAINPETARGVANIVEQNGMRYADVGVIGGRAKQRFGRSRLYLSGEHCAGRASYGGVRLGS